MNKSKKLLVFLSAVVMLIYPARGYYIWERVDCNGEVGPCSPDYWEDLYCYDCGANKSVTGATMGHNWNITKGHMGPVTCGEYLNYYCGNYNCNATKSEKNLNPTAHSIDCWETEHPTCIKDGLMQYGCLNCSDVSYTEVILATGYTYLYDWAEILAPSCTG